MSVKISLDVTPEEAKNLLMTLHNTLSVIRTVKRSIENPNEDWIINVESYAHSQELNLLGIESLIKDLEIIFGEPAWRVADRWGAEVNNNKGAG